MRRHTRSASSASAVELSGLRRLRPLLGTLVEIRVRGAAARLETAVAAAFAAIERVQQLMSFHDPRSDVSRINAAPPGEPIRIDSETHAVLRAAREFGHLSGGAFDIATAAELVRAGFLPEPSAHDALHPDEEARKAGGQWGAQASPAAAPARDATYRDLELLPKDRVLWSRKGWIDLGGIAKGYAVDRAAETLRSQGIDSGVVNAGGDLRCFGEPQPIHLRAPDRPATLVFVGSLSCAAIATSAGYFCGRRIGGHEVAALVDPGRATCVAWDRSISVAASDCMTADALTKVVRLAPQLTPHLLRHFDAQALLLDSRGMRTCGRPRVQLPQV